jgi:ribosomal protein L3 glutamine methyltransferase
LTRDELWREVTVALTTAGAVYGHGTVDAGDEAAWLVSHVTGRHPVQDPWEGSRPVESGAAERARTLARARVETRKPLAYLIHEAWFAGRSYYVDERVLVPRSPIAELIEDRFRPWLEADRVRRVLDLCAGSGCIGIACAHAFPDVRVDLGEFSGDALEVARTNIRRHGVADRVRAVRSDLFDALAAETYDLIVSNPPYVDLEEMQTLPAEFLHEPERGLDGGEDGLDLVRRIIAEARGHLNPGGILVVEVGNSEGALVESLPGLPFTWLEFEFGGHGVVLLEAGQLPPTDSPAG